MLGGVFAIDDLTGVEITKLAELPSPWGIVSCRGRQPTQLGAAWAGWDGCSRVHVTGWAAPMDACHAKTAPCCRSLCTQVVLWGFLLPTIYVLASSLTNVVFKDALILKVLLGGWCCRVTGSSTRSRRSKSSKAAAVPTKMGGRTQQLWPAHTIIAPLRTSVLRLLTQLPQAPCPNCNTENTVYFGDILTIQGEHEVWVAADMSLFWAHVFWPAMAAP